MRVVESKYFMKITSSSVLYILLLISFQKNWFWKIKFLLICFHCSLETTATFIAKVGGDPVPGVKWTKGKWRQLSQGGRIFIHQKDGEAKLEIRGTTKTDSGLYRCVAFNKHGEIESNVNLQVDERKPQEKIEGDLRAMLKK